MPDLKAANPYDYDQLRTQLAQDAGQGPRYWRSLNELAQTPEFEEYVHREFPEQASEWHDPVSRRRFLSLMGASLALAGVTAVGGGCAHPFPEEKVVPDVHPPEFADPGKYLSFSTAMPFNGYGYPVRASSFQFRPIKVDGNPDHPASLGAANVFAQASLLTMYDPERSQTIRHLGQPSATWSSFAGEVRRFINARGGSNIRLRILTETVTSPTLISQIEAVLKAFPKTKWHQYQPVNHSNSYKGTFVAFGRALNTVCRFDQASRIVSLDSDFLHDDPGSVRYSRDFIDGRRVRATKNGDGAQTESAIWREQTGKSDREFTRVDEKGFLMNRLYVVESTVTITGAMADNRLAVKPSQVEGVARAIMAKLGVAGSDAAALPDAMQKFADEVAADLQAVQKSGGFSLIVAGPHQPPAVHAIAALLNSALGNVDKTISYIPALEGQQTATGEPLDQIQSIAELTSDLKSGLVDILLIVGGNPVYNTPRDLPFSAVLHDFSTKLDANGSPLNLSVHLGLYYDETGYECQWHVPQAHYLESWGDVRAYDGSVSIIQPLINPLYKGQTANSLFSALLGEPDANTMEIVHRYWQGAMKSPDFDALWQDAVAIGYIKGASVDPVAVKAAPNVSIPKTPAASVAGYEVAIRPDFNVWDGCFAANGWLQELPRPITKISWDNVILVSPATAQKLGESQKDSSAFAFDRIQGTPQPIAKVSIGDRQVEGVVWVLPGLPDDSVTIHLGFGRTRGVGQLRDVPSRMDFNAYDLFLTNSTMNRSGAEMTLTGKTGMIATTQDHQLIDANLEERRLIRPKTIDTLKRLIHETAGGEDSEATPKTLHLSLYPQFDYTKGHRWGMVIDQNACIGCNACVVACQAENNIPVVGKEQIVVGREMHWLRIDTYFEFPTGNESALDNPTTHFQPMMCQHCEQAPCEVVCPVAATTHSSEGINEMTYNRCVGTRYCSNNCPYKVRRFNFLQYTDRETPVSKLMRNPFVTVRSRGVMEKCTYCVQRVNQTRISLKKFQVQESESTDDVQKAKLNAQADDTLNGLQTACQQSCPTEAIFFGDLNAQTGTLAGEVTRLKRMADDVSYSLLDGLNTHPRTTYLARFFNPNPALPARLHKSVREEGGA